MIKTRYLRPINWLLLIFVLVINWRISHSGQNMPHVVTTIEPIRLIAAEIIGSEQSTIALIPAGSNPHNYQLKPSHVKALKNADLIIWVGNSLELFMNKVINNLSADKNIITLERLPELKVLEYRSNNLWQSSEHNHAHEQEHPIDGHVWLSPVNAIVIANAITDQLTMLSPGNQAIYQANLKNLTNKIHNTDNAIKLKLASYNKTPFLIYHDAFQYFEYHYGLTSLGAFITESSQSLSAKRLNTLNKLITSENVKCIFADQQYNSDTPRKVAAQTGIQVVTLDPIGNAITLKNGGYIRLLETISENMLSCFSR